MDIDGIAGQKTKEKLVKATKYDEKSVKEKMYKTPSKGKTSQAKPSKEPAKEQTKKPTSTAVNVTQGFSQNDITLMANAIHGETRGETYEEKETDGAGNVKRGKDQNISH